MPSVNPQLDISVITVTGARPENHWFTVHKFLTEWSNESPLRVKTGPTTAPSLGPLMEVKQTKLGAKRTCAA